MCVNKAATAAVFFMLGVGLISLKINWIVFLFAVLLLPVFLTVKRRINFSSAVILLFFALLGAFYYNFRISWEKRGLVFGEPIAVQGLVDAPSIRRGETQKLTIKLSDTGAPVSATTYSSALFEYGDVVKISGILFEQPGGRIVFSAPVSPKIIKRGSGSRIKSALFSLKDSLENNIKRALPPDKTALPIGTLLGDKSDFTGEFDNALKRSGLAHIAALSGFNVMILIRYLTSIVGFFILHRSSRFAVIVSIIAAFIVMTGASASLVRAGIMGVVGLALKNQSRLTDVKFILIWTALFMVLINPTVLIFDLGFSLSFSALIGLIYIEPLLKKLLTKIFKTPEVFWRGWKGLIIQTLAAESAVSPIILVTFRQFSPWAVFSNLLILPLLPVTMLLTFITALGGYISSALSVALSWPLYLLVGYEEVVINIFGGGFV